jgi:hypothetical protein
MDATSSESIRSRADDHDDPVIDSTGNQHALRDAVRRSSR